MCELFESRGCRQRHPTWSHISVRAAYAPHALNAGLSDTAWRRYGGRLCDTAQLPEGHGDTNRHVARTVSDDRRQSQAGLIDRNAAGTTDRGAHLLVPML